MLIGIKLTGASSTVVDDRGNFLPKRRIDPVGLQ